MTEPYLFPKTINREGTLPAGLKSKEGLLVPQDYFPKQPEPLAVQQLLDEIYKLLDSKLIKRDSKVYLCYQDLLTDVDYSPEGNLDLC